MNDQVFDTLDRAVQGVFTRLDRLRCFVLRRTLQQQPLRAIYCDRTTRLQWIFLISLTMSFVLAVLAPYTMLLFNPLLLGLPHLVASLRYASLGVKSAESPANKNPTEYYIKIFGGAVVVVALMRLWTKSQLGPTGNFLSELGTSNDIEVFASLACIFFLCSELKLSLGRSLLVFLGFMPVLIISTIAPMVIIGGLHIGHNFMAFFYWRHAAVGARNPREVTLANQALLVFTVIHVLIFAGALDFVFPWQIKFDSYPNLPWLNVANVGASTAPWLQSMVGNWGRWCSRLMLAYVFGQSLHYSIWLRCVAEQNLSRPIPVTFRQTLGLLKQDFGRKLALGILAALSGYLIFWLLATEELARLIYISFGALHGYVEIVGFLFLTLGARSALRAVHAARPDMEEGIPIGS